MKKIFYLFAFAFIFSNINAQTTGGPDAYGYIWKSNNHTVSPPTYSWFDITTIGTQVTGLADDNFVGPFSCTGFQFYWYPVSQFWIGSNGYISFSPQNIASPFPASVPLSSGANDWIAPLMSDLNFTGSGNTASCYYYANSDTVCISFINVPFWANTSTQYTGSNTFQIILNKVDKSITFNYLSASMGTLTTMDNVVGIENNSGTLGLSSLIDQMPTNTSTRKFYYPTTVTYAVTDGGMLWNGNDKSGGYFIQALLDTVALSAKVKNFGNQNLSSFTVKDTVINSTGAGITGGVKTVPSLAAGNDTLVNFTNTFIAPAAGTYRFNTKVTGISGDMVSSNNTLQQEIIAVNTSLPTMTLDYSDGIPDGGGIGWSGGDGGIGIYIKPPIYPAKVVSSRFYISANAAIPVGFHAMIYDDDGVNGAHGTLVDSVYVAPTGITLNTYTTVPTSSNIQIDSGGVYLVWLMDAADINLARDTTSPISRQTYEIVGGGWSGYRDKLTEDFLMGLNIQKVSMVADYYADLTNSPTVQFSDSSSQNPTSWAWDFGVPGATSTLQNPSYTYTMNGNYNVCLIASNATMSDTVCKTITITSILPVAGFTYDATNSPIIAFTDTSVNAASWAWDFGVPGATSTLQNPTYTYPNNGSYSVCLTVNSSAGSDSVCKTITISNPPVAGFTYDATNSPKINFTDTSIDAVSWVWVFGVTGATSTLQNPDYTYTANGVYKVCVTATNTFGSDSSCQMVSITNVGLSDISHDVITRIYPNPNDGKFLLEISGVDNESYELSILNSIGSLILTENINTAINSTLKFDLNYLKQGLYFVKIRNQKGEVFISKFVVQ